jgi:hypothetical protein
MRLPTRRQTEIGLTFGVPLLGLLGYLVSLLFRWLSSN